VIDDLDAVAVEIDDESAPVPPPPGMIASSKNEIMRCASAWWSSAEGSVNLKSREKNIEFTTLRGSD